MASPKRPINLRGPVTKTKVKKSKIARKRAAAERYKPVKGHDHPMLSTEPTLHNVNLEEYVSEISEALEYVKTEPKAKNPKNLPWLWNKEKRLLINCAYKTILEISVGKDIHKIPLTKYGIREGIEAMFVKGDYQLFLICKGGKVKKLVFGSNSIRFILE